MSVVGQNILAGASGAGAELKDQENGLKFIGSPKLERTPSSASNRKIFTFSTWYKKGRMNQDSSIFGARSSNGNESILEMDTSNRLVFKEDNYSAFNYVTTAKFRDQMSWYHIVCSVDTTQATAADRVKIFINGNRITAFDTSTAATLNADTRFNDTQIHTIGVAPGDQNSNYLRQAALSETHFVDGSQWDASKFGIENATSGLWEAIEFNGPWGTNGFYLDYSNAAAPGTDSSGNTNTWTATGFQTYCQSQDTPTNNFAQMQQISSNATSVSSRADIEMGMLGCSIWSGWSRCESTLHAPKSGQWYAEVHLGPQYSSGNVVHTRYGVLTSQSTYVSEDGYNAAGWYSNEWTTVTNGTSSSSGDQGSRSFGDVLGFLLDEDNNHIYCYKNGVLQPNMPKNLPVTEMQYGFGTGSYDKQRFIWNHGQDATFQGNKSPGTVYADANGYGKFTYDPTTLPGSPLALCTKNIAAATIEKPQANFKLVHYTSTNPGALGTQSVTGVGFQPDMVWLKNRSSGSTRWTCFDSARGAGKQMSTSQSSETESNNSQYGYLSSFDADGFTLTGGSSNANYVAQGTDNYTAFCWKGGGAPVSNTNGTITTQVSANPTAGFSCVAYTGNGTNGATIGHGLGTTPDMIITMGRGNTGNWLWHQNLEEADYGDVSNYIQLGTENAMIDDPSSGWWGTRSSTILTAVEAGSSINNVNQNTKDYVAWCFKSIPGYSRFGLYRGNGVTDGQFVWTGFRPQALFVKCSDTASRGYTFWNSLEGVNANIGDYGGPKAGSLWQKIFYLNSDGAVDGANYDIDIMSTGFKLRTTNNAANQDTKNYIYAAWADRPYLQSNAC